MRISIIIPTHNRASQLKNVLNSIIELKHEAEFEFVIVDNNSTDDTKHVVETFSNIARYVFEGNTSFTKARRTGRENATGDILLYLDDDVIVWPGSLRKIVEVFSLYPNCGVIAGRIEPKFIKDPPHWTLDCQKAFNGWSLYNPEYIPEIVNELQEVSWAAGPMMAIRRSTYDAVGGFPPDTLGVETNKGPKSFNKLYIGPGDYGLCIKARQADFKVYYSSDVAAYHIIPPLRLTLKFWRSRIIGEGYHAAITQRCFFKLNAIRAFAKHFYYQIKFIHYEKKVLSRLKSIKNNSIDEPESMTPDELLLLYNKAYLDMDWVLRKYPTLSKFLWEIGDEGVNDSNFDVVFDRFPVEFKNLVNNDFVFDSTQINSVSSFNRLIKERGYYNVHLHFPIRGKFILNVIDKCYSSLRLIIEAMR